MTHQITNSDFNQFKQVVLKYIPKDLKKSPSEFLSSVCTLYVMMDEIECDKVHIKFKNGSFLYIPINKTPILNEIYVELSKKFIVGY